MGAKPEPKFDSKTSKKEDLSKKGKKKSSPFEHGFNKAFADLKCKINDVFKKFTRECELTQYHLDHIIRHKITFSLCLNSFLETLHRKLVNTADKSAGHSESNKHDVKSETVDDEVTGNALSKISVQENESNASNQNPEFFPAKKDD